MDLNRARHGWGPFSLTHLTSGDVLEQLDSPCEDDRALNSRAREIDGMRLKKMTEEIIYFFESFCGKVLRLRVFENRHYPTCAAFMEFATILISVSQPPADGVYSSASSTSYQGSLK
ncbi:hypothetical protein ACET3Z_006090 [Daucus carota]